MIKKEQLLREITQIYLQYCFKNAKKGNVQEFNKFENLVTRIQEKLEQIDSSSLYGVKTSMIINKLVLLKALKSHKNGFEISNNQFVKMSTSLTQDENTDSKNLLCDLEMLLYFCYFALNIGNLPYASQFITVAIKKLKTNLKITEKN